MRDNSKFKNIFSSLNYTCIQHMISLFSWLFVEIFFDSNRFTVIFQWNPQIVNNFIVDSAAYWLFRWHSMNMIPNQCHWFSVNPGKRKGILDFIIYSWGRMLKRLCFFKYSAYKTASTNIHWTKQIKSVLYTGKEWSGMSKWRNSIESIQLIGFF